MDGMEMLQIPPSLMGESDVIAVQEKTVEIHLPLESVQVFYLECGAQSNHQVSLLLLHEIDCTSRDWLELGTLQMAATMGVRAVAVDLPGYGQSAGKVTDTGRFLGELINKLDLRHPIIVSPSISGCFSLPYVLLNSDHATSGFVPVAPVIVDSFSRELYERCWLRTLVVYGENDDVIPDVASSRLRHLPRSTTCCFPEAGHRCYWDFPDMWHNILYSFIKFIEPTI